MDADKSWVEIFFEKLTTFCVQAPPLRCGNVYAHTFRKRIKRKLDNPTFSMSAVQKNPRYYIFQLPALFLNFGKLCDIWIDFSGSSYQKLYFSDCKFPPLIVWNQLQSETCKPRKKTLVNFKMKI